MPKNERTLLAPDDEARLKQYLDAPSKPMQQRAKVVMAYHDGASANEAAKRSGLTVNQVNYLWRVYRQKGLDLFFVEDEPLSEAPAKPEKAKPSAPAQRGIALADFLAEHGVNLPHAEHVGALAAQIFDATMNLHRLPQNCRPLLETAALVHNIAYEIDPPNHHLRGRDLIMAAELRGFTDDERRILACTTSFHRKKVRPEAEPVYMELAPELRRDALALSAILRVADGLDHNYAQLTTIREIHAATNEVTILLEGQHAVEDAAQANKKADLWNQIFPARVRVSATVSSPAELPPAGRPADIPAPMLKPSSPSLTNTVSVTRAGRLITLHTVDRIEIMLRHLGRGETGPLAALYREARRLHEVLPLADAKDFRKEARWFMGVAEQARIASAVAERAAALGEDLTEGQSAMQQIAAWESEAKTAIAALDPARFGKMAAGLREALTSAPDTDERVLAVFQAGAILWEQLSTLRQTMEYGTSVEEALGAVHKLQDYLLAFRELLGAEVAQVLDMLAPLENTLSAIQIAQGVLSRTEPKPIKKGRKTITPELDPVAVALRASQEELLGMLADSLPDVWVSVNSAVFRRAFALAIAAA